MERNAIIIETGDTFCAMQGKFDKRKAPEDIRPEHNTNKYLQSLTNTAATYFEPYASNYLLMGDGNHETAILKHNQYDLIEGLLDLLNARAGTDIIHGNYAGNIVFSFEIYETQRSSFVWNYSHGYGGGGPVTRNTIQTNRRAVYNPDATVVTGGHVHEHWVMNIPRQRVSSQGVSYLDNQIHIQLPTYKEEFNNQKGGFHIEKGRPPKPIGAQFARLFYHNKRIHLEVPMCYAVA